MQAEQYWVAEYLSQRKEGTWNATMLGWFRQVGAHDGMMAWRHASRYVLISGTGHAYTASAEPKGPMRAGVHAYGAWHIDTLLAAVPH